MCKECCVQDQARGVQQHIFLSISLDQKNIQNDFPQSEEDKHLIFLMFEVAVWLLTPFSAFVCCLDS